MPYVTIQTTTFRNHFIELPKDLQKRAAQTITQLEAAPLQFEAKNVERLKMVSCWTCRVSKNHRILYSVHEQVVKLIDIGTHDHIYNHVVPTQRQLDEEYPDPAVIEAVLDPNSSTTAAHAPRWPRPKARINPEPEQDTSKLLPMVISDDVLKRLDIPAAYRASLLAAETEDDLLDAGLPEEVFEAIYAWLYDQPTLAEIAQEANYVLNKPQDLERYADGDLLAFLLYLDPEQRKLVDFSLKGPTLVKGGPGSGKSTVALYRIKALVEEDYLLGMQPRILFTTYTNTLVDASNQLLRELLADQDGLDDWVTISTLDKIAYQIAREVSGNSIRIARSEDWQAALNSARVAFNDEAHAMERQLLDLAGRFRDAYLIDELQWVIEGQHITTLAEYLKVPRYGRSQALTEPWRRAVWAIYEYVSKYFQANQQVSWNQLRLQAIHAIEAGDWTDLYDYVVVDEAQDLTPVGLALCLRLCRTAAGLFLTADASQSLYNKGFSWNKVHDDLRVTGRTRILKRNYRTTRQIAEAAHHFLHGTGAGDDEVLDQGYVHTGARPVVHAAPDIQAQFDWIREQIYATIRRLRQGPEAVAILVPRTELLHQVIQELTSRQMRLQVVDRNNPLDLTSPSVKVMTIHAAKGLEFPVVVLPCLDEGNLPRQIERTEDYYDKMAEQRRLFYVACTRAMRYLLVTHTESAPSPFVTQLDRDLWEFDAGRVV